MDLEFQQGFLDYQYVVALREEKISLKHPKLPTQGIPKIFMLKCLLYGFSCGATMSMCQLGALINAPLMVLFNKTSREVFGVDDGGILLLSAGSWMGMAGMFFSLAAVIPLMDFLGRKVVCVYIKFTFTALGSALFVLSWLVQNGLLYLLGVACLVVPFAVVALGDIIFLSEIAPSNHKAFFAMLSFSFVTVSAQICTVLAREDMLGTPEKWGYIPLFGQALNMVMLFVGHSLPDPEQEKLMDQMSLAKFYQQHFGKFAGFLRNRNGLTEKLLLVMAIDLFAVMNISLVEGIFLIPIYRGEGMDVNEILSMGLIVFAVLMPFRWIGPMILTKIDNRKIFHYALPVFALKSALHLVNSWTKIEALCYVNQFLEKIVEATGLPAISYIIATEIFAPEVLVIATQLVMVNSTVFMSILTSLAPFTFGTCLPYYLVLITVFSAVAAKFAIRFWRTVDEQGPESEVLLRKCSPPPGYSEKELLI
ncbi:unnamed protein product, partial [Mesorhabditis spiculigera]